MPELFTVLRVEEEMAFTELGKPAPKMRVQFKVGEHGPFYERFDREGFNAFQVKQRLELFARDLETLKG